MMQREWLWALSAAVVGALLWLARRRRSRSAVSEPSWEARLEEQVQRLGERESELEQQMERLSRHEDALERQVSALALQEGHLEEQVQGIGEREKSMQLTIDDLGRRESQLEGEVAALRGRESELKTHVEQLEAKASRLEAKESQLEENVRRLQDERDTAADQAEGMSAELASLRERLDAEHRRAQEEVARRLVAEQNLEAQTDELRLRLAARGRSEPAADSALPHAVETFSDLIDIAREHLECIELPNSAEQELDALDAAMEAKVWVQDAWLGLRALDEYAQNAEEFAGGFWEWCEHGEAENRWPATPKKLAMSESRTVMESRDLRLQREFEISTEVKAVGRVVMEAHLKVAEGGGQNIPRIYFHDDAKGSTGKVHIGFIGPHRLVPTKNSS